MNNNPLEQIQQDVARNVGELILLAKQNALDDPYHFREYYGRYRTVVPLPVEDGTDVWFHPLVNQLNDPNHYFMHYPIVEEIACHRAEILFEAARVNCNTEDQLTQLKGIRVRFYSKLQVLANYYWQSSQPRRMKIKNAADPKRLIDEDKKEFHEKSARIRLYLDKLQEDMALLIAKSPLNRASLNVAATTLHQAELTSYPALTKRDLLRVEFDFADPTQRGNWQYFDRHYHDGQFSLNSHDTNTVELANYAQTYYGSLIAEGVDLVIQPGMMCSRYGSPTRLNEYEMVPEQSPHLIRLKAYRSLKAALIEDAALAPNATHIHHCHTHLITAGGVGSYLDHQRRMFEDASVASFALRQTEFGKVGVTGTYSYCSFGVNPFRRGQNAVVEFTNHVALLDLFLKAPGISLNGLDQQSLSIYQIALKNVKNAAQTYFEALEVQNSPLHNDTQLGLKRTNQRLDTLYHAFVQAEEGLNVDAESLFEEVKEYVLQQDFLEKIDQLYNAENYHQYYALASLRLVFQMCDGVLGQDSWANLDVNGVLQALMQIACGNSGIFSSYGCKNANDRSLLISMHLYELQERMKNKEPFDLKTLKSLTDAIHPHHSQNISLNQTIKDTGAPPKFKHTTARETRGLNKLLQYTRFARHKAGKVLKEAIKSKPTRDLARFNFDPNELQSSIINDLNVFKKNPIECLNTFLHKRLTAETLKEDIRILFSIYPEKHSFSHTRQASVRHFLSKLDGLDNINELMKHLWFHYNAIQNERGLSHKIFKTALLKILSQFYHANYLIDFPELLHAPKSKIEECLRLESILDEPTLATQRRIRDPMRKLDSLATSLKYKFKGSESITQRIDKGLTDVDAEIQSGLVR